MKMGRVVWLKVKWCTFGWISQNTSIVSRSTNDSLVNGEVECMIGDMDEAKTECVDGLGDGMFDGVRFDVDME